MGERLEQAEADLETISWKTETFEGYDSPVLARTVWNEYRTDMSSRGHIAAAVSVAEYSNTVDQLDARLSLLETSGGTSALYGILQGENTPFTRIGIN